MRSTRWCTTWSTAGTTVRSRGRPQAAELAPAPAPGSTAPRRICLFAAYDLDGIVDDYVVAYLRELSRFADVYYLADGFVPDDELAKLAPYTRGAWSRPHGAYDFGSLAILADELVGWDVIETYDELMFANDSAYLLRPLDELFARMDAQDCDWWGMQATKRDFERSPEPATRPRCCPTRWCAAWSAQPEWHQVNQLHVSSYFIVPAQAGAPGARASAGSSREVRPERMKSQVILKYEIGLSRVLLSTGHRFATFVEGLYPYHPLYTVGLLRARRERASRCSSATSSPRTPGTPRASRAGRSGCSRPCPAPTSTCSSATCCGSSRRRPAPAQLRDRRGRRRDGGRPARAATTTRCSALDRATPTYDHWWAFPVCAYDHTFAGNERAVFEMVRDDPSIKKIILTRSRKIEVDRRERGHAPADEPGGAGPRRAVALRLHQARAEGERARTRSTRTGTTSSTCGTASR